MGDHRAVRFQVGAVPVASFPQADLLGVTTAIMPNYLCEGLISTAILPVSDQLLSLLTHEFKVLISSCIHIQADDIVLVIA